MQRKSIPLKTRPMPGAFAVGLAAVQLADEPLPSLGQDDWRGCVCGNQAGHGGAAVVGLHVLLG
jgi:hypothetical protein